MRKEKYRSKNTKNQRELSENQSFQQTFPSLWWQFVRSNRIYKGGISKNLSVEDSMLFFSASINMSLFFSSFCWVVEEFYINFLELLVDLFSVLLLLLRENYYYSLWSSSILFDLLPIGRPCFILIFLIYFLGSGSPFFLKVPRLVLYLDFDRANFFLRFSCSCKYANGFRMILTNCFPFIKIYKNL